MANIQEMRRVCQETVTDSRNKCRLKGSWWNVVFSRHVSIYLTALFVRLGVRANQVTGMMLAVGFVSFLCALPHILSLNILALALFLLFYILDCSDGEVARWTNRYSRGGVYLDYAAHVVCNGPLFAAAALHRFLYYGRFSYGILAVITLTLALWAYSFKMIPPAIFTKERLQKRAGKMLVHNRRLAGWARGLRLALSDLILAPMAVIASVILSHYWAGASLAGAVYGLSAAFLLSAMHFVLGFIEATRFDVSSIAREPRLDAASDDVILGSQPE